MTAFPHAGYNHAPGHGSENTDRRRHIFTNGIGQGSETGDFCFNDLTRRFDIAALILIINFFGGYPVHECSQRHTDIASQVLKSMRL